MLYNEMETAWKEAAQEWNADKNKRGGTTTYGTVPAELKPWEYEFLMVLYARDEFDQILTGPDRHHIFARWACYQYGAWSRITEREYRNLFMRCNAAADNMGILIPAEFRRQTA